jgi:hypothetical protein
MSGIIGGILAGTIVLILKSVARNAGATRSIDSRIRIARYPFIARAFAWLLALIPLGLWAALVLATPVRSQVNTGIVVCGSLTAAALVLLLEFNYARLSWSDARLTSRSPWRRTRTIDWLDVVEVRFLKTANLISIRDRSGVVIRIPTLVGGLGELFHALRYHAAPSLQPAIDETTSQWQLGTRFGA